MNHKIANILKSYIEVLPWADKVAGLTQVANIRLKEGENKTDKSYPISCDIDADACKKGKYQDLAPDQKKKSVMFFEDRGGVTIEKHEGNRIFYQCQLRLVVWLNIRLIEGVACDADASCGVSGDYVIDVIKAIPYHPFDFGGFYGIFIDPPEQVERSVDIFNRYTFNEPQTQYLMHPFDYFALDFMIHFAIPCDSVRTYPGTPIITYSHIIPTGVTVLWGAATGATGYQIDVATDPEFGDMVINNDDVGNVITTDVAGLDPDTTYYIRVRAYSGTDYGLWSDTLTMTTDYWTLPSFNSLELIHSNLHLFGVGGFSNDEYWSSTESNATNSLSIDFTTGGMVVSLKNTIQRVRGCRSFTDLAGAYAERDTGPAGGLIYYVSGTTYYEAASADITSVAWSNIINVLIGTTSDDINESENNTNEIIAQAGHIASASLICKQSIL